MQSNPLINVLIRTHRNDLFKKCISSVVSQLYPKVRVIVCYDDPELFAITVKVLEASQLDFTLIKLLNAGVQYDWNYYCNSLKEQVTDGWFFYLDDDDWLIDRHVLTRVASVLNNPDQAVMVQFQRGKKFKPSWPEGKVDPSQIIRGKVGGSCIFLHHSQKLLSDWDGRRAADYRFIKDVAAKIPMVFHAIPVVKAGNNGLHGAIS